MNHRAIVRFLPVAGLLAAVLGLGLFHQPFYPATWLDEGFVLQGALNLVRYGTYAMKSVEGFALQGAMNLVRYGMYAMRSVEGFRVLDQPLVANGPGVVLPISLAFKLFGIGLLQARVVMAVYMVLAAAAFLAVARRLFGPLAAVASLLLLLALPAEGFLFLGRQALGNVPALAYFLVGSLLRLTSLERERLVYPAFAGILWGAAMITKGQYGLLLPTLAVMGVTDRFHLRQVGLQKLGTAFLAAVGCLGVWQAAQLALVGWESYGAHLSAVRASAGVTVFAFRSARIPGSVWYLVRSGILAVVAPGLLYGLWSCWKKERKCAGQLLLLVFSAVWLMWYALVSVGWHRYAFAPYAAGCLLTGNVVVGAMRGLGARLARASQRGVGTIWTCGASLLVLGGFVAVACGLSKQVRGIVAAPDLSAQKFARYLDENIEAGAVVESWEWELDVLVDLRYHHPTNDWVDRKTAMLQFGDAEPEVGYPLFMYEPDYLIDGPFSKWTHLYSQYISEQCTLTHSVGRYDLYACLWCGGYGQSGPSADRARSENAA